MDKPSTVAVGGLQKIYGEVKDSLDPIIISSIESLIEKTYDALQDDEDRKQLFEETFKRGVELMQKSKYVPNNIENFSNEPVDESKIEDLILSCLEGREPFTSEADAEEANAAASEEKTSEVLDHAYSKRVPPMKLRKSDNADPLSLSSKSQDRREDMLSLSKVKKVLKSGPGSNPFIQRVSTATSTGLPKYMFTPRAGQIKAANAMSKTSVKVDIATTSKVDITKKSSIDGDKVVVTTEMKLDKTTIEDGKKVMVGDEVKPKGKTPQKPTEVKPDPPNTVVTKHTQLWAVGNFSKKMKMGCGKSIDSMFFSINVLGKKTDWSLMLYPNGDKERVSGFLSLYLTCRNRRGLDMSLEFKFTMLDGDGKTATTPSKSGSISAQMLATNSSWGWESFVKQKDLQSHGLLINNKLTICCDITLKIQDPEMLKQVSPKDELVIEDDRDIDALVNFVGELSVDETPKKKKSKKSNNSKVQVEVEDNDSSDEEEEDDSSDEEDEDVKTSVSNDKPPTANNKPNEPAPADDVSDFQIVTRRRRKNSQTNATSSPAEKPQKSKNKSKSKAKSGNTAKSSASPSAKQSPPNPPQKPAFSKVIEKKPCTASKNKTEQISSMCLDTKESLEELLKTKNLLEENIGRLTELEKVKSTAMQQMIKDKETKLGTLSQNQEQLRQQKQSLEAQVIEQQKIIEQLKTNINEVDTQMKRGTEKEARLKIYLDMNIADASSQLARLGKEKDDLGGRLDQVENKLRGNRRKERLLTIHNQILRLQTNLECPICIETASSPIYQCREGHLVCSSCVYKIARCPMCRQDGPVNIRNRYAENDSNELCKLLSERDEIMSKLTSGAIHTASC